MHIEPPALSTTTAAAAISSGTSRRQPCAVTPGTALSAARRSSLRPHSTTGRIPGIRVRARAMGTASPTPHEPVETSTCCSVVSSVVGGNRAVRYAPWADMFVALDPHHPFWEEADKLGFTGVRVCGVDCDYDAMYAGPFYERVGSLEIRNNALAALRIAFRSGAKRIILLGFDT